MTNVRERRVELHDGVRLRVEERGEASEDEALLLLHGFTGSVEAWGGALLDELARSRRVVAVDLPGHGASDAPPRPERYRIEQVVDDLARVLDDAGIERATWIGYSMGGRVALAAAVRRGERVSRLVLESASPGIASEEERRGRRMSDEALARRLETASPTAFRDFVDDWMELPLFATQRRLPDPVREAERRRRLRCDPAGLAATLRGLGAGSQPSFWEELVRVEVPTLLLAGGLDDKFSDIALRMEAALPRAHRVVVEDAGHTVHLERPGSWLQAVRVFLSEG